jgi:hypothetical protein
MFNSNDILARLQNGERPEAIANEMADSLNHAIDQFHEEGLNDMLDCAADDILTYLRAKYPKECEALDLDIDGEDLEEILDALMAILPVIDMLGDLNGMLGGAMLKTSSDL